MAREHARVKLSIWEDEDFRMLSSHAQHLYFVLMTSPKLDYCGVTDWRPSRLAPLAGGWTIEAVEFAAQELSERLYIIIDTESEEVLLRSFIRNDELLESPNMAVALRKAHAAVASSALRAIVVHELVRLHADKPELKGWTRIAEMLKKPELNPSEYPSFNPSGKGSPNPPGKGNTNPSESPSVRPSPTTAPATAPSPATEVPTTQVREDRYETLRAVPATEPPTCSAHPFADSVGPCAGCARVRTWRDKNEERAREAATKARQNCRACGGSGWIEDADGKPSAKCNHRRTA